MNAVPLPALHASHAGCWLRTAPGQAGTQTRGLGKGEAVMAAADTPLLLLNAPLVATRLGYPDLSGLDLLELFAFVHPAQFCVPTPHGLAQVLDLAQPTDDADVPRLLQEAAGALLARIPHSGYLERICFFGRTLMYPSMFLSSTDVFVRLVSRGEAGNQQCMVI